MYTLILHLNNSSMVNVSICIPTFYFEANFLTLLFFEAAVFCFQFFVYTCAILISKPFKCTLLLQKVSLLKVKLLI